MPNLSFLLRGVAPYVFVLLAVGGAWTWGYVARGAAESERAARTAVALRAAAEERMEAALEAQRNAHAAQLEAAERRANARQKAGNAVQGVVTEVRNEPTSTECIDSAAIVRAVDGLRALEAARADGGDQAALPDVSLPVPKRAPSAGRDGDRH